MRPYLFDRILNLYDTHDVILRIAASKCSVFCDVTLQKSAPCTVRRSCTCDTFCDVISQKISEDLEAPGLIRNQIMHVQLKACSMKQFCKKICKVI